MKIIVDATILARDKSTGVDNYFRNLLAATVKQMPKDEFKLTYMATKTRQLGVSASNVRVKRFLSLPERFYSGLLHYCNVVPFNLLTRTGGDVYIFPNFSRPPLLGKAKSITFIYDLAFARTKATNTPRHRKFLDKQVRVAVKHSSHIVACSESTKNDLIDLYSAKKDSVSVIYPAVDHSHYYKRSADEISAARALYNLPQNYLLYLGTIEPRKNIVRLMQAYAQLSPDLRDRYPLVLAGGKGWLDEEIEEVYANLSKKCTIIRTGYVSEEVAPALYSGASLFVYPSLYEGFGMPPLEAMACGVPVVTSDNSSLPEVVSDAGLLVDASSTSAITEAMKEVLGSKQAANELRKKGEARARYFSWEEGAIDLKRIITMVYNQV